MKQTDILIIGIIYNTYLETLRYLDSLQIVDTGKFLLILIDNSNKELPADFLEKIKEFSFLNYVKTDENLGYFGGARKGLKFYLKEHSTYPQWVIVTNVDIVFTTQFFNALNKIKVHQNLGIIAPSIISQKWSTDYNPKIPVRNSKRKILFYQFLYSSFLIHNLFLLLAYLKKWITGLKKKEKIKDELTEKKQKKIYAPHGSCLVFNKSYFFAGGTLDLPNFLFGEEIFVAETAARLRLDVIYHPELVINDYEHASIGFFMTPTINKYYRESNQIILDRFYH